MNKRKKRLQCLISFTIIINMTFMNIRSVTADNNLRVAKIKSFSGTVKIGKSGGEKSFKAVEGMSLVEGDSITTEKNSSVTLYIDDDKEVKIGDNSMVNLSQLSGYIKSDDSQTGISLWVGKVWSNIKKKLKVREKYEIKVPTAVMGVRGTEFSVESTANGEIEVAVQEGVVTAIKSIPQDPSKGDNGKSTFEITITKNEKALMNQDGKLEKDIIIKNVQASNLSLFVLQILKDYSTSNPGSVDPNIVKNIDNAIKEKESAAPKEENEGIEAPKVRMDPSVTRGQEAADSVNNLPPGPAPEQQVLAQERVSTEKIGRRDVLGPDPDQLLPIGGPPPVNQQAGGPPPANRQTGGPPPANQQTGGPSPVNQQAGGPPPVNQQAGGTPPVNQQAGGSPPVNQQTGGPSTVGQQTGGQSTAGGSSTGGSPMQVVVSSVSSLNSVQLKNNTTKIDAIKALPSVITLNLNNGSKQEVTVTSWNCSNYDENIGGEYTFTADYNLPSGVSGNKPEVTTKVEVSAPQAVTVSGVSSVSPVQVDYITSKEQGEDGVLAVLPTKIKLSLSDGRSLEVSATWKCANYIRGESGDYIFTAEYYLPSGVSGSAPIVVATVTVLAPIIILDAVPVSSIQVINGTTTSAAIAALPSMITLNLSNGTSEKVPVTWECANYDGNIAGDYSFIAEYGLPYGVMGEVKTVTTDVVVLEPTLVSALPVYPVQVSNGTTTAGAISMSPLNLSNGANQEVPVMWESTSYDGNTTGEYTFKASYYLPSQVNGTAKVTVLVPVTTVIDAATVYPIQVDTVPVYPVQISNGTTTSGAISVLPSMVKLNLSNGKVEDVPIKTWQCANYDGNTAGEYTFKADYDLPYGVTGGAKLVTADVVVLQPMVIDVAPTVIDAVPVYPVQVSNETATSGTILTLSSNIILNLSDGTNQEVPVTWECTNYDGNTTGEYIFVVSYCLPNQVNRAAKVAVVPYDNIILTNATSAYQVDTVPKIPLEVSNGTTTSEAISMLPSVVKLKLSDGTNQEVPVTWECTNYDGNKGGVYTFKASYDLPSGVSGTPLEITTTVTVN